MNEIEETLKQLQFSQLYLILQHDQSIYFEGMPSKALFKECFKALINKQETNLAKEGMMLCEFLKVKPEILKFMLKVFNELNFIYNEDGLIKINSHSSKKDIETSRLYQLRQSRIEVEKRLLYDDFSNIKKWIKSQLS